MDFDDSLLVPMDDDAHIKLEKLEHPYCLCGELWVPVRLPMGYIRQCPTCAFSSSFCKCGILADPRTTMI